MMRILQRSTYAVRLAKTLYRGESLPISVVKSEDEPLSVEWWTTNVQAEGAESDRHFSALLLYLELAKSSKITLPEHMFPARFDLDDTSMRPDKGVIKVFLDAMLIAPRMMGSQLVFDVTGSGKNYLASRTSQSKL